MTNLTATGNRVIIRQLAANTTTTSGILLQSSAETPQAEIVAVGNRVQGLDVGDTILVDWNRVGEFEHNSIKYHIVIDENVLAVVEQ